MTLRTTLAAATLTLGLAAATHAAHAGLTRAPTPPTAGREPSPKAVRLLSCGNAALAADVAYLRAVSAFGDKAQHRAGYPSLAPLLRHSVTLDPNFAAPYLLAATGLLFVRPDAPESIALVREGCRRRPELWELHMYRGFWAYDRAHDVNEAADAFGAAARTPRAPLFLGPLAVRLAARSQDPQAGLAVIDAVLALTPDEGVRDSLRARRPLLLLEHRMARLERAARAFREVHKRTPRDVQELLATAQQSAPTERLDGDRHGPRWANVGARSDELAPGTDADEPLAACAEDPLGGPLWLDANGHARTHHEAERLRLHAAPTARPTEAP